MSGLYEEVKLTVAKELKPNYLEPENIARRRIFNDGIEEEGSKPCFFYRREDGERISIAAKTELVGIAGDKKSRKSLLGTAFILSRFEHIQREKVLGFELDLPDATILAFDTEQPRRRVKESRIRYHEIAELKSDDERYVQYSLKGMSPHAMIEVISSIIDEMVKAGNSPDIVFIDQIADLLTSRDENDKVGASNVIDWLDAWGGATGALMIVSMHNNRTGGNTNGKMGSLLDQKVDSLFRLNYDYETRITSLTHPFARDKPMPGIKFTQDLITGHPKLISEDNQIKKYFK